MRGGVCVYIVDACCTKVVKADGQMCNFGRADADHTIIVVAAVNTQPDANFKKCTIDVHVRR